MLTQSNATLNVVDFDDMLYLPILLDTRFQTFDYVMVDESQDTNAVQRAILHKLVANGGRLIAVGDASQAIYGFRGADSDALDLIASEFSAARLPLSVSYRCPRSVVAIAQQYSDNILPRDDAPEGMVLYPNAWKLSAFEASDLIVCRNTAPLIGVAYKMLARRLPCKIMGRDIGRGLIALVRKLSGKRGTLETLSEHIVNYQDAEVAKALAKRQEQRAQSIEDRCQSLLALIDGMTVDDTARGVDGLIAIIDGLFSDNGPRVTTLATVHKAKGLEAPRVFILDPHLMPSKYAKAPHQQQQESNIIFVAVTRSLDTLVYVDSKTIVD
jgi:DNA helicase-2/ATP-dependent DNA helicase PcrA